MKNMRRMTDDEAHKNMGDMTKLERIENKIDLLQKTILAIIPSHKLPAELRKQHLNARTPEEVQDARRKKMLYIFEKAGKDLKQGIKINQKYPYPITADKMEAVPRAVLLNRSAAAPVFAAVVTNGELSAMENARVTLTELVDNGELVLGTLDKTTLDMMSKRNMTAMIVWSAEEWGRVTEPKMEKFPKTENVKTESAKVGSLKKESRFCDDCGFEKVDCICNEEDEAGEVVL